MLDPIRIGWVAMHPNTPFPAALEPGFNRGNSGEARAEEQRAEEAKQRKLATQRDRAVLDPLRTERNRAYMREYQRRRRAALAADTPQSGLSR